MDKWIKKMWDTDIYNGVLHSHKKLAFCDNIDGSWRHYTTRNKSDRERRIPYDLTDNMQQTKKNTHYIQRTNWWLPAMRGGEGMGKMYDNGQKVQTFSY